MNFVPFNPDHWPTVGRNLSIYLAGLSFGLAVVSRCGHFRTQGPLVVAPNWSPLLSQLADDNLRALVANCPRRGDLVDSLPGRLVGRGWREGKG